MKNGTIGLRDPFRLMGQKIITKTVVIVVDDDPLIRMAIVEALLEDGFDVLEAAHAREAIAVLQFKAESVHALFTDINMPGDMDGIGLAYHARIHWPWLSILVTSGRMHPTALPEGARFMSKPYDLADISLSIREMRATA